MCAEDIANRAAKSGPGNPARHSLCLCHLGEAYRDFNIIERSATCYRNVLKQYQRLTEIDQRFCGSWALVLNDYAAVLSNDGRVQDLVAIYQDGADFLRNLNDPEGVI